MTHAVPYYRVSTKRQERSRLGLDAQLASVHACMNVRNLTSARVFYETESGKSISRPQLARAVRYCQRTGAVLVIAKIDRLARNALLVATLINSGIQIVAADKPNASHLDLLEDAIRAQREGEAISARTKEALAVAKEKGVQLGRYGTCILSGLNREAANRFARTMQPMLITLHREGFVSCRAMAAELNKRKISTFSGGRSRWHATTIFHMQRRLDAIERKNTSDGNYKNLS